MEVEPAIHQSFGEILRAYRKRKRMTQKQLAQLLDTHANTISSWELGTYLPQTRGLVLELARHLGLNDQETRQLLEASLTALSRRLRSPGRMSYTAWEGLARRKSLWSMPTVIPRSIPLSFGLEPKPLKASRPVFCRSRRYWDCQSIRSRIKAALPQRCDVG